MTIKYCINCENQITPSQTFIADTQCDDFCSQECADEYLSNADERVLLLARESNPDALPISELTRAAQPSRSNTGILPSTLEAVQSLLQIGGVSQEQISKVVNIDKANADSISGASIDNFTEVNNKGNRTATGINRMIDQKSNEFPK